MVSSSGLVMQSFNYPAIESMAGRAKIAHPNSLQIRLAHANSGKTF